MSHTLNSARFPQLPLLPLLLLLLLSIPKLGNATVDSATLSGLVALYEATGGGSWVSRSGWMGSTSGPGDPCTSAWYGVTCDSGEVTVLNMAVNSLLGVLPTELGDLTSMKEGGWHTDNDVYVSLFRSNSLAGSLPSGSLYLCSLASATFSIR